MSRYLQPVPRWITEGFEADPVGLRMAIGRFYMPVTSEAERLVAQQYTPDSPTYACSSCHKFAFAKPTLCYTCRRARADALNEPERISA